MDWINIHTSTLDSEAFIDATPIQRGTWLCLMRYCCGQENGGFIQGCAGWSDRKWQQIAGVTEGEVQDGCGLFRVEEGGIRVEFYPVEKEVEIKEKRRAGKKGGRQTQRLLRHKPVKLPQAELEAQLDPPLQAQLEAELENSLQRKGREGKGIVRERNGMEATTLPDEKEILDFGSAWAGDLNRGIPAGMPEAWCLDWYAWRSSPAAGPWPADWQSDMVRRFTAMWLRRDRRTLKPGAGVGAEKNGEKPATLSVNVAAIAAQQQRREWEEELHKLRVANESLYQAGAEIPASDRAREKELERWLKEGAK